MCVITVNCTKTHFTNSTQHTKHSLPTTLQSVKPSNSLPTFRTTTLHRLQYHNNVTLCPFLNILCTTVCHYAQYTVIIYWFGSSFTSNSHTIQPSTPHCITMLFLCFHSINAFRFITIFHSAKLNRPHWRSNFRLLPESASMRHYRDSSTVCWNCNSLWAVKLRLKFIQLLEVVDKTKIKQQNPELSHSRKFTINWEWRWFYNLSGKGNMYNVGK